MLEHIKSIQARDPAAPTMMEILFAYNGFHAVLLHRINNAIWRTGLKALARVTGNLTRMLTGVEIHPEAKIGKNLFIDHATGVVIGQTSVVGDNVLIYHGVTLGGKGGEAHGEKRHPTIKDGAIIGAGAQVLGNIIVGEGAKIGSNAVVTKEIPANCTAVGNPARLVDCKKCDTGKSYGLPDKFKDPRDIAIQKLIKDVEALKKIGRAEGKAEGKEVA